MKPEQIDEILAHEEPIAPSRSFLASVMRAVRREAATLPPLKFPWLRALPGILATFVAISKALWELVGMLYDPPTWSALMDQFNQLASQATEWGLQWIVLAVAITVISLTISLSVVGGRHYPGNESRIRKFLRALVAAIRTSA